MNDFIYPDVVSGSLGNSSTINREGASINDSPFQGKSMNLLNLINALMLQTFICIYISFYKAMPLASSYNNSRVQGHGTDPNT